jgi:hypothetical protein
MVSATSLSVLFLKQKIMLSFFWFLYLSLLPPLRSLSIIRDDAWRVAVDNFAALILQRMHRNWKWNRELRDHKYEEENEGFKHQREVQYIIFRRGSFLFHISCLAKNTYPYIVSITPSQPFFLVPTTAANTITTPP